MAKPTTTAIEIRAPGIGDRMKSDVSTSTGIGMCISSAAAGGHGTLHCHDSCPMTRQNKTELNTDEDDHDGVGTSGSMPWR